MKKAIGITAMLIGILFAAVEWSKVIGTSDHPIPPDIEVMKSDTLNVYVRNTIFGFTEEDTTVDSKNFTRIYIPDEEIDRDPDHAGKPQIPYIKLLIAVPDSAELDIKIYNTDYMTIEDYLLYPVPDIVFEADSNENGIWEGSKEVYTYDTAFYNTDTIYPDKFYEVVSDGHWRDQRVVEIFLYPVQYNPKYELMYFYPGLDLQIEYSGTVVENTRGLGPFEDIGREILVNYPGVALAPPPNPDPEVHYYTNVKDSTNVADYIIVTHEDFLADSIDSFWIHELADWRVEHNRFEVGIVKMNDIYDSFPAPPTDSAKSLRDFLVYAYDKWSAPSMADTHFAYCLFIGDWEYVPIETCYFAYGGAIPIYLNAYEGFFRDIDSTHIDPTNSFEDIMLGRWPIDSTELAVIAQKTIDYEQSPNTLGNWRRRGLLIAGGGGGEPYFLRGVDSCVSVLADIEYDTLSLRWKYDSGFFADTIPPLLEMGAIITAYYDHSSQNGWPPRYFYSSNPSPEDLTNGDSLSAILSYSCSAAMFQRDHPHYDTIPEYYWYYDTCFAECFLYNDSGGAVAFYGGTAPTWTHLYTPEPLQRMLRSQQWILGKMLVNTTPNSPDHCFALLGDPALDLGDYTAYPELPDLVIRPQGLDFSTPGYPYYKGGDTISIGVLVWNIGADTAFDVDVDFDVVENPNDTIFSDALVIDTLLPRDTAYVVSKWNTGSTHPYFYGTIGDCKIYVNVDPDSEITESWEGNNSSYIERKIALYPYQSGWPKKVTSGDNQPAIGNLDGDGSVEIVFIVNDSVYVFDKDGNTKLGWPKYVKKASNLVLADLDCMGNLEIIVSSEDSLTVFDYQGSTVSGWPQAPPNPDSNSFHGSPSVGYISGADKRQVISCIRNKYFVPSTTIYEMGLMVYDYDGDSLYYLSHHSMYCGDVCSKGIAVSHVNTDGNEEMVTSYEYHDLAAPTPTDSCFTDIFNKNGHVRTLISGSEYSIPAMVDLGADGVAEIIIGDMNDTIRAYKERTQTTLWKTNTYGQINSSPAVGDIHPSYEPAEIAFGNDAEEIWAIRGDSGTSWYPYPIQADVVGTSPALAKLGGKFDWYPDIVVAAEDWIVYGLGYDGDNVTPFPLPVFGTPSSPVIGDIDGDKKSETILATGDGYLHVWRNVNSYVQPYALEWPQYHHDYQRTGLYNWVGGVGDGDASPPKFSTSTIISFSLTRTVSIQITVYDVDGNVVKNLVSQVLPKGSYNPVWYGKNNSYALLPNGIYIIEFKVDNERKYIPVEIDR
jgi:hypothetical protein